MNFSIHQVTSKKLAATFIAFSFVFAVFFGVHFTMQMNEYGTMPNCPLLGQLEKECPMTVAQHISAWQQLFTATFQPNTFLKLLLIVASLAFSLIVLRYFYFSQILASSPFLSFRKTAPPFRENYLLAALSQGVLRKRE